ncbi:ferritin-like domain-containing protein [Saccharophagus degradans]|uniref:DUF2383 domain-containing protein n=1 Tax=Saccharophagus degradans (strain 2-40 / ATCC 43961 / DSM 17024) TaxID=203122 RepID=Q21P44_SACD2|nr:PA2169 family four-helix-bundle protein [Saccharophagus degradans]ABD79535.1 conserved hypothetical protein [Saccharophagus degradans 2-40]
MNSQAKPSLKTNLEAVRFNKEVEIPKDKDYLTHLNDLVRALNSSIHFYRAANQDVPNVLLAGVFNEIAESHRMCVEALQPFITYTVGEPEEGNSFAVELRKVYASVLACIKSDTELTYLSNLEEVEDKLLELCDRALEENIPVTCRVIVNEVRASIQVSHDRMLGILRARERLAS